MSVADIVAGLELNTIKERQWSTVTCSAVSGKGLAEGMDYITYIKFI